MTDALTIGWNTARVAERRAAYRRVLALNLCIHLAIGLGCLFFPHWIAEVFGLPGPIPTGWTRGWGATLLLVTALYVPGWLDPVDVRAPNLIGILGASGWGPSGCSAAAASSGSPRSTSLSRSCSASFTGGCFATC
jgi:hypothetical protein